MTKLIKYIWPVWLFLAFQMPWNIVATFFHGDNSAVGNWIYGRHCNWTTQCDGPRFIAGVWIALSLLFIGNAAYQIYISISDAARQHS